MNYSVVTICLNSIATIKNTIESVLGQSILPAQYVFVDGGSTDGTLDVIQEACGLLRSRGIEALLINQIKPEGVAGIPNAWNIGIAEVRADVVCLLNSDDWYGDKKTAEKFLGYFEASKAEMVVGQTELVDVLTRDGKIVPNRHLLVFPVLNPINHPATFVLLSVYKEVGGFDERYFVSADYDFLYRCYKGNKVIVFADGILVSRFDGGYAVQNKSRARLETRHIALRHSGLKLLPNIAYYLRLILNR